MIELLGKTLPAALDQLARDGVSPEVLRTECPRRAAGEVWRVVRVREGGREITIARFPDQLSQREDDTERTP